MKSFLLLTLLGFFPPVLAQAESATDGVINSLPELGIAGALLAALLWAMRWQQDFIKQQREELKETNQMLSRLVERKTDAPPNGYDFRPPTQPRRPDEP